MDEDEEDFEKSGHSGRTPGERAGGTADRAESNRTTGERELLRARVLTAGASEALDPSLRRSAARAAARAEMQREVIVRLVLGGVFFAAVVVGATLLYIGAGSHRTPGAVRPVLEAFMHAADQNDVLAAHHLYSARGLEATSQDDVARLLDQRALFEGYSALKITAFKFIPAEKSTTLQDTAVVTASVSYDNGTANTLTAQLDYDDDVWHISYVKIQPTTP